jgi:DNA-binding response OmpR family regulator
MRILLVEDHVRFARSLEQGLREESIEVVHALDGGQGLERVARGDLDLIVLDLGLPDLDGIDVLSELRRSAGHVPVLVLTARDSVESRVQALELGADDYLVKPFAFAELVARIRALSRRAAGPRWAPRIEGVLSFDDENGVHFAGQRVMLSPREHALLAYLLRRRGEVVPRCDILREVFGCVADPGTNALDVHLTHLRRKLSGAAVSLETVRGVGIRARLEAE